MLCIVHVERLDMTEQVKVHDPGLRRDDASGEAVPQSSFTPRRRRLLLWAALFVLLAAALLAFTPAYGFLTAGASVFASVICAFITPLVVQKLLGTDILGSSRFMAKTPEPAVSN